jgi:hypothetical protein
MTTNVSIWIRAFRPPLQGAYQRPDEPRRDLIALLERADERKADTPPRARKDQKDHRSQ